MKIPARGRRAFTLIELIVVIVIMAILVAIGAFAYNKVIDSSRASAARAVAAQVAKSVQAHSAAARVAYSAANYPQPAVDALLGNDLPADATASGMVDGNDTASGEPISVITVTEHGKVAYAVFRTGDVGTAAVVSKAGGTAPIPPLVAPAAVQVDQPVGSTADLSWAPVSGATGYTIQTDAGDPLWTGAATTASLTGLAAGTYTVAIVATSGSGNSTPSAPVSFTISTSNDMWANAWPVGKMSPSSPWTSGQVTNAAATHETGEYGGGGSGNSLWWSFTPSTTTTYRVSVVKPGGSALSIPWIFVFGDGASVGALPVVYSDGNAAGWVKTQLTAGNRYFIRAGSNAGGAFQLKVEQGEANDVRSGAVDLGSVTATTPATSAVVDNTVSGMEAGEYGGGGSANGLWWSFTPSKTTTYRISAPKSGSTAFRIPWLYVFDSSGFALANAVFQDGNGTGPWLVQLNASTTYYLRVGSTDPGAFQVKVEQGAANDMRSQAIDAGTISVGSPYTSDDADDRIATVEAGEYGGGGSTNGLWWKVRLPDAGSYTFKALAGSTGPGVSTPWLYVFDSSGFAWANVLFADGNSTGPWTLNLTGPQTVYVRIGSNVGGIFRMQVTHN